MFESCAGLFGARTARREVFLRNYAEGQSGNLRGGTEVRCQAVPLGSALLVTRRHSNSSHGKTRRCAPSYAARSEAGIGEKQVSAAVVRRDRSSPGSAASRVAPQCLLTPNLVGDPAV